MDHTFTRFYQLGNGGQLVFEQDLEALADALGRPSPAFFGVELNDQPGDELQWLIYADLRGKKGSPTSENIQFVARESNWMNGLVRAMQEALARLCGQNVDKIKNLRFIHYARHDSMGRQMDMPQHRELNHHVEQLDFLLRETIKELDNARACLNASASETTSTSSEDKE